MTSMADIFSVFGLEGSTKQLGLTMPDNFDKLVSMVRDIAPGVGTNEAKEI